MNDEDLRRIMDYDLDALRDILDEPYLNKEEMLQDVIDEFFGSVPYEEILSLLKKHYPENFL